MKLSEQRILNEDSGIYLNPTAELNGVAAWDYVLDNVIHTVYWDGSIWNYLITISGSNGPLWQGGADSSAPGGEYSPISGGASGDLTIIVAQKESTGHSGWYPRKISKSSKQRDDKKISTAYGEMPIKEDVKYVKKTKIR